MAAGERDLLQLLANPTNRAILRLLFVEPQYPRRLAELVGLTEDEASRRLRLLEKQGVAEAAWANVGRNVRLYRLATTKFQVELGAAGVTLAGLPAPSDDLNAGRSTAHPAERVPEVPRFVGRTEDLRELDRRLGSGPQAGRALCITAMGGTGKSTLAAQWARGSGRPVVWHTVGAAESGAIVLSALAAGLRGIDAPEESRRLLALRGDEAKALATALAERLDALGAVAVVDRLEAGADDAAASVTDLAQALGSQRQGNGRLLITSRTYSRALPRALVANHRLHGLALPDTQRLLASFGHGAEDAALVQRATGGHPLSVVLAAQVPGGAALSSTRLGQEAGIQQFLLEEVFPQLSDTEREALLALAVLRQGFTAEEAEAVVGARHTAHALLRLEGRGLVGRAGDQFFLHDLVRTFAADAIPDRAAVHARAAKVLLATREPRKAVEALHHLRQAHQDAAAAAIVRDEVLTRRYRFAELGLAAPYLAEVDAFASNLGLEPKLRPLFELEAGAVLSHLGDPGAARLRLESCARHLPGGEDPALLDVPLRLAMARLLRMEGDNAGAAALYTEVENAATRGGQEDVLLEALVEHGFAAEMLSDEEALAAYERAIAAGAQRRQADPRLLSLAYAGASRVAARWDDARFEGWAERALELARVAGYLRGEASVYTNIATRQALAGDLAAAAVATHNYLDAANRLGDPWMRCCAMTDLSFLQSRQGDPQAGLAQAEECARVAIAIRSSFYALAADVAAAEALNGLSRAKEAKARLLARVDGAGGRTFPGLLERAWRALAASHRMLGDETAAAQADARSQRIRRDHGLSGAPTALFVAMSSKPPASLAPRTAVVKARPRVVSPGQAKFVFECPDCGQRQHCARMPRVTPQCCGNLMRLLQPA